MAGSDRVEAGRQAFARRQWRDAYAQLGAAIEALEPEDLERAAVAAYLTGVEADATAWWRRAHHEWIDRGQPNTAARCGFWIGLALLLAGDRSQSAGWLARTQRLLHDAPDCAERGFACVLEGLHELIHDDAAAAIVSFDRAVELAARFTEPDLLSIALLAAGQARIQLQREREGVRLLDEAMATVTAGDVSPIAAGIVYCAVILTCQRIADLRRACEWTLALDRWCGEQPELVAFRGACLVHRSEVFQLRGQWSSALEEAERAHAWAVEQQRPAGRAAYQCAELLRLRGELERAEGMYAEASRAGVEPQPGLSLLRLARGELQVAAAAIRRVTHDVADRHGPAAGHSRARVLAPCVEIMIAAGELADARAAALELAGIAQSRGGAVLRAMSCEANGALCLADGDPAGASAALREAWAAWEELGAPYESARVRVLIGRACEAVGDMDTARSHFDAAAATFEKLGAAFDRQRLDRDRSPPARHPVGSLSARELEVLSLLAAGRTNRAIGEALFISEHTVARHVSNIFHKIDVTSRTAAAAYAFAHGLCGGAHGES
jgi:DNA-binding NarL/FixJ family response regulator